MKNSWLQFMNSPSKKRRSIFGMLLLFMILLGFAVDFSATEFFLGLPKMWHLIRRMLAPNLRHAGEIFPALWDTIKMAWIGTFLGVAFSIPVTLITAQNITFSSITATVLNKFFSLLRTIPSLIWAAILVSIFSVGEFSGIAALFVIAFLMSQKLLRESIEGIPKNTLNSIRSVGGNSIQALKFSVFPKLREVLISTFFVIFESNIRSAAVLGFVGAGGIGQVLWKYLNHMKYDDLSTVILILFLTILIIDAVSHLLRKNKSRLFVATSTNAFRRQKKLFLITRWFFFFVLLYFAQSAWAISFERFVTGMRQGADILWRMAHLNWQYVPNMIVGLSESLFIALFATLTGAVSAIFLTFLNASNTSPYRPLTFVSKIVVNILRTFPPMITAIILFRGLGPGKSAGAIALSLYTAGVLTKMFSEVVESVPSPKIDALAVTGANIHQIYYSGLFPETFPYFVGLALYRMESNLRNSTVLGIIGAGGIGTLINLNIMWRNWENTGVLILGITAVTIAVESISYRIRKKLFPDFG